MRNPAYQYSNFIDVNRREPGAFSKSNPFINQNTAEFYSDQGQAQSYNNRDWSPGFKYNPPQTGVWTDFDHPFVNCCQNSFLISPNNNKEETVLAKEQIFNANWGERDENQQWVQIKLPETKDTEITYQLYDMQGKLIVKGVWRRQENNRYSIRRPKEKGMYLLKINTKDNSKTLKMMVGS